MRAVRLGLLVAALLVVGWIRLLPLEVERDETAATRAARSRVAGEIGGDGEAVDRWIEANQTRFDTMVAEEADLQRDFTTYEIPGGRRLPYVGGFDSYVWLRAARNQLRHGSPCDSVVDGKCRDDFTLAPVGTTSRYASSFHVRALVFVHRILAVAWPGIPLDLSAVLLSYFVAVAGVLPAFWLGARFGGAVGGFLSAILVSLNATVMYRTFAADNDVWNVVLPLIEVWAAVEAIYARKRTSQILFILLSAAATGLHAATWRGWILTSGVVVLGLTANALLFGLRRVIHGVGKAGEASGFAAAALLLGVYLVAASAATWVAGAEATPAAAATEIVGNIFSGRGGRQAASEPKLEWPSVFDTVGELRQPNLAGVAQSMAGPVYFFVAWLGLILLMLPRSGWQSWHFAILVGGNLLYRYLLSYSVVDPWTLATFLLVPLAVAVGAYLADGDSPAEDQGAGAMIILWFLAGLLLSFRGHRFLIVLAPPLGVLCAVAVGRLYQWVERQPWAAPPVRAAVLLALVASAYPPVVRGVQAARSYRPIMNDTWDATLKTLRDRTPAQAIVNTWWDYGYFVKHVAERRVLSDGGTLATHVHYWFSRAMIADSETETLGLLRMLNCGSDAYPEPEGQYGAFGTLVAAGVPQGAAALAIIDLASLDRSAAREHLRGMGLSPADVERVLERTHCRPAPAYLVLPASFPYSIGWRSFGSKSFVDTAAARLRDDPDASSKLVAFFAIDADDAEVALRRAGADRAAARTPYYVTGWVNCSGDGVLHCVANANLGNRRVLREVLVPVDDPAATRLVVREGDGAEREEPLRSVLLAESGGLREIAVEEGGAESVLVDIDERRVLVGADSLLRSTATRLMFLGDAYLEHFVTTDRQDGPSGAITTWEILW